MAKAKAQRCRRAGLFTKLQVFDVEHVGGQQEMRLKKQARLGRKDLRAWASILTGLRVGSSDGISGVPGWNP